MIKMINVMFSDIMYVLVMFIDFLIFLIYVVLYYWGGLIDWLEDILGCIFDIKWCNYGRWWDGDWVVVCLFMVKVDYVW